MSILKVAKMFHSKLALASDSLSEDLRKIMASASALTKAYTIYDDEYDAIQNLAARAYQFWNMSKNPTQVIPASTVSGWLQSLTNSAANAAKLISDTAGKSKINAINNMIAAVQPMDIGSDAGSTYVQEAGPGYPGTGPWQADLGADEEKLQDVVKNMAPKPNPWDPEAQEPF